MSNGEVPIVHYDRCSPQYMRSLIGRNQNLSEVEGRRIARPTNNTLIHESADSRKRAEQMAVFETYRKDGDGQIGMDPEEMG